ncbi:MAG: division/cell wall cluster transcriptional repressor MraZ [Bacilli bacterium]|nr:division/cell wall cluster transcriptional repressor MraZ [Bacilli bacterium]
MFMGEYHHNIDDKGRIIIPSKFRYELGEKFIVTKGLEGCLFVYPKNEWDSIISKLKVLPFTKKDARIFMRFFLSSAIECEFDKQGRINITSPLADYAGLTKECVVIGVNDRLEVWNKEKFEEVFKGNEENLSDIADNLFNEGF